MQDENPKTSKTYSEEQIKKMLRDLSFLKKVILQEQAAKKEIEDKLREKDIEIQQKREEIESLTFTNSRLAKRVESLIEDVNKLKNDSKSSFLGNLLHGKQKDELEKLREQFNVLTEDYQVKVEENEKLHIHLFEVRKSTEGRLKDLESQLAENKKTLQEQNNLINELSTNKQILLQEINTLENEKRKLQAELNQKTNQLNYQEFVFEEEKAKLNKILQERDLLIKSRLPFNENKKYSELNIQRIRKADNNQLLLLDKIISSGSLSIDNFVKLAEAINLKISFISAYTEEEDQKNYYSFSKKICDEIPLYKDCLSKLISRVLQAAQAFKAIDYSLVNKNNRQFLNQIQTFESKISLILEHKVEYQDLIKKCEDLFKHLLLEEVNLVNDIEILKTMNNSIIEGLGEIKSVLLELLNLRLEKQADIMNFNYIITYIQVIAEKLKKLPQLIEKLKNTYKEKSLLEEEGIEKGYTDDDYKGIIYVFKDKIPIHKLKTINNDIRDSAAQFCTHFHSLCLLSSEFLEKEVIYYQKDASLSALCLPSKYYR